MSEATEKAALAEKWKKEIDKVLASREYKDFTEAGKRIVKIYRNSSAIRSDGQIYPSRVMYNVLWSNVQVMKPTLLARLPKVVVLRRHEDSDPVGRLACEIAERATRYMLSIQEDQFMYAAKSAVADRLLPGRGQLWLRYDAQFESVAEEEEQDEDIGDEVADDKVVVPNSEKVVVDYVYWEDYLEAPARTPYEVRWKARRSYLTKTKFEERFGKELLGACAACAPTDEDYDGDKKHAGQIEVFEIWDKETKKVYWLCPNYSDSILDVKDDTLNIEGFFPCPIPLCATTTTDSQWPVADYSIYKNLAEELNYVCEREQGIVGCIRLVGVTAAVFNKELGNLTQLKDGQLWPVDNWAQFVQSSGLKGMIDWMPFDQCIAALPALAARKQQLLSEIYEITGIPDIVRGSSDPTETAAAQQQKSKWVSIKVSEKQADVQRFLREAVEKTAQIILEPGLFSDETLALMAGYQQMSAEKQQMFGQALGLLRNDRLRTFRVTIETDSTIAIDEESDKAARMEFVTAITQLFSTLQPVAQFRPELLKPALDTIQFAARAFKAGRTVEASWAAAIDQIEQSVKEQAAQPPQPPPPDPAIIQAQAYAQDIQAKNQLKQLEMQNHYQEMGAQQQVEMQKLQFQAQELQQRAQEAQMRYQVDMQKIQLEAQKVYSKQEIDQLTQQLETWKAQFNAEIEKRYADVEQYKVMLSEREKLLEEERLKQQNIVDVIRAGQQQAQPPVVNIMQGSGTKEIVLKRASDGSLVGTTKEIGG